MVDIHCHLLEELDDGSQNIDTTNKMIKIAEEDGITDIIATPHYHTNYFENSYEKIVEIVNRKNEELKINKSNITIFPGQEIFIDKYTLEIYKSGIIHGLNDSKYLLIESNLQEYTKEYMNIIYELRILGVVPIIAHPERYIYIIRDNTRINDFIDEGCLFQINSSSLMGLFGSKIQKTAKNLIRNGVCNFIASDAHSIGGRAPRIKESLQKARKINKALDESISLNPRRVIKNEHIDQCACNMKKNKKLFWFSKN